MPKGYPKNGINKGWFSKTNPAKHTAESYIRAGIAGSIARRGKKLSEEHKAKIAQAMKGKNSNENNPQWKGNSVKYMGLHNWVRRHFGTPKECENCGETKKSMYHWANISGEYRRDRLDWKRLCVSCHKKYDTEKL